MSKLSRNALLLLLAGIPMLGAAQDLSGDNIRSLDGQVQEIKSDVLNNAT